MTDLLIYISGVNDPGGLVLDDTTPDDSGFLMRKPMQDIAKKSGAKFIAIGGSLEFDQLQDGLRKILGFITNNISDPPGKLIIYGYSAGGNNGLELCRRIELMDVFLNQRQQDPIVVDLLITVDAARRNDHLLGIARGVAGCVTKNLNFFQTFASPGSPSDFLSEAFGGVGSGAHGAPNHAVPSLIDPQNRAQVDNRNLNSELSFFTKATHHAQIERVSLERCKQAVNDALSAP